MSVDPIDQGGEAPCFAHLLDDDNPPGVPSTAVVAGLGAVAGSGGAVWSLPHGGDLDANLVRLDAGQVIATHRNDDVDVMIFVRSGGGQVTIGSGACPLEADHLVLVPKGCARSITAGPAGITYLSVHRRRPGVHIATKAPEQGFDDER